MTTENLITAPQGTDMRKAERILRQYKIEKLPVVNKDGLLMGLITYRDILQIRNYPNAVKDGMGRFVCWCRTRYYQRPARPGGSLAEGWC